VTSQSQKVKNRADERLLAANTPLLIARSEGMCEVGSEMCAGIVFDPESDVAAQIVQECFSRHHRRLKRQGGTSELDNLVLACGSGTSGCHGWIHRNPQRSRTLGWLVSAHGPAPEHMPWLRRGVWTLREQAA